jgi:uncharacterized protein (DUF1330 family)
MAAYVMAFVRRVHDRKKLEAYWSKVGASFEGTDVKPRSVYKPLQVVEGGPVESAVMLEFPTAQAARDWYFGEVYQAAKAQRDGAADIDIVIVESGVVVASEERMPHVK